MKSILAIIMVTLLSFSAFAADDRYELKMENNRVVHDDSDWIFLKHEHSYAFSMSKSLNRLDEDTTIVHSFIQFDHEYNYATFTEPTYRIYTMGLLSCSRKSIMLLRQIYVKKDGKIQAIQPIQPNQYVSELEMTDTARHQMYLRVCSGEIV